MDAELERWKSRGRRFDYLGFDVFYAIEALRDLPGFTLLIAGVNVSRWRSQRALGSFAGSARAARFASSERG